MYTGVCWPGIGFNVSHDVCYWTMLSTATIIMCLWKMNEYVKMVEWCWQGNNLSPWTKICLCTTLSMTNPIWTDLEFNLGLHNDRLVSNYISHGTVCKSHGSSYFKRRKFFPANCSRHTLQHLGGCSDVSAYTPQCQDCAASGSDSEMWWMHQEPHTSEPNSSILCSQQ